MIVYTEIFSNIRQAREHGLLGNYESALTFYSCGLALIKKHLSNIKEYGIKQQWIQVDSPLNHRCFLLLVNLFISNLGSTRSVARI